MKNKYKFIAMIFLVGVLMVLGGKSDNNKTIAALSCCAATKDADCGPSDEYNTTSCVGSKLPCPYNYGSCYITYTDPYAYCSGWTDWANCKWDINNCYETRWCTNLPLYQIRICTCPTPTPSPSCTPVNGGWTTWGTCSAACTQSRTCTNPTPSCGGTGCTGISSRSCTGGNCCTASAPTPVPTLSLPANLSKEEALTVDLSWSGPTSWGTGCPSNSNEYKVYVDTNANPTTLRATLSSATRTYAFSGAANTRYYWKVEATNGSNSATSTPIRSFYTPGYVSGTIYNDADNLCSQSDPENVGGGLSASLRGTGYTGTVTNGGTYSILSPQGSYSYLDLLGLSADYLCSTGPLGNGCGLQSCPTATSVSSQSVGNNFFLTQKKAAWWQADGAGVYAGSTGGGQTILSQLPLSTSRMIVGTTAPAFRASGSISKGVGEISDTNINAVTTYTGTTTNYSYFVKRLGILSTRTNDFSGGSMPLPYAVRDYWYQKPASGTVVLDNTWSVTANKKYTIVINGDLRITNNITVSANNAFLIFIVSGKVTVDPSVSNIQGLYVMDGQFVTTKVASGDDVFLTVNGSIVTWAGVSLGRDLGLGNTSGPAEKFVYRADLLANMPTKLKGFIYTWQEVAPGTYGN